MKIISRTGFLFLKKKYKHKLLVFSFFLLISTLFWFLIKLSDNYITNITYPVEYLNIPENKIIINELPEILKLKIDANGYNIVKYKLGSNFSPIKIDLSETYLKNLDNDSSNQYIESFHLLENIQNQIIENKITQDISIVDILPDTLFFEFTDIIEKKIPVGINAEISFQKQYMLKDKLIIEPDSVLIKGPEKIIDTIFFIETEYINLRDLAESYTSEVNLIKYKNIIYSTEKVFVEIQVEEFTEAHISIPINVINLPDTLKLKIFPNIVNINYLVGFSEYGKIDEKKFDIYIDYNDINNSMTNKLKLKVKNYPLEIKSFNYSPIYVEYLIEK